MACPGDSKEVLCPSRCSSVPHGHGHTLVSIPSPSWTVCPRLGDPLWLLPYRPAAAWEKVLSPGCAQGGQGLVTA